MSIDFERVFSFGMNTFKVIVSEDNKSLFFQVLSMDERFRKKSESKAYKTRNNVVVFSLFFPEIAGRDEDVNDIFLWGEYKYEDNKVCVFKCDNAMKEYERIYYALLDWYENWFPKDEIVVEIPRWKRFVILPRERKI